MTEIPQFEFPKIHSFPPLFTSQPNATILQNQLNSWSEIILAYCQHYSITSMSIDGSVLYCQNEELRIEDLPPLFENKLISRAVSEDFKQTIFKHLIHKLNKAEYINSKKPELGLLIYYRSLVEWSKVLYDYVENSGQLDTILTVYELTKLEDSGLPQELKNLDYNLLVKILKNVLIKQGSAQIIMNDDGSDQIGAVKIV